MVCDQLPIVTNGSEVINPVPLLNQLAILEKLRMLV